MSRPKKTTSEKMQELGVKIQEMKVQMYPLVDGVVKELSFTKYGHGAGNVTAQDLAFEFKRMDIEPKLATELARGAIKRHEQYRWSDGGKQEQGFLSSDEGKQD